jgi:hypothetical protein
MEKKMTVHRLKRIVKWLELKCKKNQYLSVVIIDGVKYYRPQDLSQLKKN